MMMTTVESGSGSVYVYNLDGTGEVKITDSSAYANANFGRRVAVGEGKILVGSQYADPGGITNKGEAWVYNLRWNW